ncbi:ribosomal protein L16 Arg81 hydroxylase [Neorhizobium galegae]|uniref:cupin domain-containing protein n=1 Tax=Neorhizobium galegae TaxID=399 RepID=UPI001AE996F7|nr:cupin domain-containing protein [Neorhizobium galegae]MBP2560099.1 ribosomal protein L16 Arg81 hydroxylase [Neorhizobium galegae]
MRQTDGVLESILTPLTSDEFLHHYWERKFLHIERESPEYFKGIFSIEMFEDALNRNPPSISWISNKQGSRTQLTPNRGYNYSDVDRAIESFSDGSTVILDALHKHVPSLQNLCSRLEGALIARVQANCYLTPANSQGFKAHYDTHDVLILQVEGSKMWRVGEEAFAKPLLAHTDKPNSRATLDKAHEFELRQGDLLYIPRGVVHEAYCTDKTSLHVTLGVVTHTWFDLLATVLGKVADEQPMLRESLPIDFHHRTSTDLESEFRKRMQAVVGSTELSEAIGDFVAGCLDATKAKPRGKLTSIVRLGQDFASRRVTGVTPLGDITLDSKSLSVRTAVSEIVLPLFTRTAVEHCLAAIETPIYEIETGGLDEDEMEILIKKLAEEQAIIVR